MIILSIILAGASHATLPEAAPFATGPGVATCATAWSRDHAPLSFIWTQGMWSGLNSAKAAAVGSRQDSVEIVAEVRKTCAQNPSLPLVKAVAATYSAMSGQ